MQCVSCGKDGVFNKNAYNVGDGGGCEVDCVFCGHTHEHNVKFPSTPSTYRWWHQPVLWGAILASILVSYGVYRLITSLAS